MDFRGAGARSLVALIVDRDADTRQLYAQSLELAGFQIHTASEGRDALVNALSLPYDVIVTETRLTGIDGYQLCDLLRRDHTTRAIPIIFVTGEGGPADLERARRAGANAVLLKPCLPETLLAAVRQAMTGAEPDLLATKSIDHEAASQLPERRLSRSRAFARGETNRPPHEPPALACPMCDQPLVYDRSYIGGVSANHTEQWDVFECRAGCGVFHYRHRTRVLRRV